MKMRSASPVDVGVYNGQTETNLGDLSICAFIGFGCHLLVKDGSKEPKTGLDLSLRVVGLNDRADDRDVHVLGANVVGRRNHGNVDIWGADHKVHKSSSRRMS